MGMGFNLELRYGIWLEEMWHWDGGMSFISALKNTYRLCAYLEVVDLLNWGFGKMCVYVLLVLALLDSESCFHR